MKTIPSIAGFLLFASAVAYAQIAPFDMSREREQGGGPMIPRLTLPSAPAPAVVPQMPAESPAPAPAPSGAPPTPPFSMGSTSRPASAPPSAEAAPAKPASPPTQLQPLRERAAEPVNPAPAPPVPPVRPSSQRTGAAALQRYVIPFAKFGLDGEYDRKSWSIYITPEQAAAPAKLNFSYQNAVVVAPEASQLTVLLNDRIVGQQPIASSDSPSNVSFEVPVGLLQPGANLLTFEATQRHRTDCTVQSTYELWTDIDPAKTYLSFIGQEAARFSSTDAIRAIGVDETGRTRINFVVPALAQPGTTKPLLRLAQGLAILSGMPNETFSFTPDMPPQSGAGRMTVVVGTPSELQTVIATPPAAQAAPLASFVTDPKSGGPVLLVSGPSWPAISSAIDTVVSTTDRPATAIRDALATQRWSAPDAPLVLSATNLTFAQLGVRTAEFSGRRFRTNFNIAVPSDFYANAYGEATVLLDAAYTQNVLPGSHIDIYVNGNIASTVPISSTGGGIFRHLPIRVTMRHFKPGLNSLSLEAILMTKEDEVCVPGTTADAAPRFALFDTSELHIPDFARIGQRPNLAGLSGTGYPYNRAVQPTPLFIDRIDSDTLSATATLLGRMAVVAGRPIEVEPAATAGAIGERDAIFIGSISQMPPAVLAQLNIAPTIPATWRPSETAQSNQTEPSVTFDDWRSKVRGGVWRGQITSFQEWLRRNFDISLSSLQFVPGSEEVFTPRKTDSFLIAQGKSAAGGSSWTIVTAPSAEDLREGVEAITTHVNWPQVAGRITTFSGKTGKVESVPIGRFDFVASQPWSLSNYRLIAANWLSTNILSYAFLLVVLSLLIGVTTASMLSRLGRRE
ncbi:cellulose biosynthesis cyclic di-GMP-binding regulatory protein BcsB [Rhizobium mesoamericanum]|uniref:Cyclic di-GMP-binding protein n=1 Tax=Rhizobium mesoamericanum STM3625 TaxID=1211777 RepID=K0PCF1_9HYPH|nr:cellulose biosynthesis cyclic di-GMP-binding regulatory protein BcsB [Rhizobium mesoamericanum]CCM74261.1 putative cellulose synthase protein [Rhizobium mesoamericanum STM3625]